MICVLSVIMKNDDFVSLSEPMAGGGSHLTACGQYEVHQNEGMDGGGSHLTACEEPDVRENHQKEEEEGDGSHLTASGHDVVRDPHQPDATPKKNQKDNQKEIEDAVEAIIEGQNQGELPPEIASAAPEWAKWKTQGGPPPEGEHHGTEPQQVLHLVTTSGSADSCSSRNYQDQDSSMTEKGLSWQNKKREADNANIQDLVQLANLMERSLLKEAGTDEEISHRGRQPDRQTDERYPSRSRSTFNSENKSVLGVETPNDATEPPQQQQVQEVQGAQDQRELHQSKQTMHAVWDRIEKF